jgi:phosphomevalonate kinase
MTRISAPGKLVVAGAFVVLDGAPAIGVAVAPRLVLSLSQADRNSWPIEDPYARAAIQVSGLDPDNPPHLAISAEFPEAVTGWSLGSSAAYVTALVAGLTTWSGRPLLGHALSEAARTAHRRAQGDIGSGLDVACCALGGTVLFASVDAGGLADACPYAWPDDIGVVIAKSPVADTTIDRVQRFLRERRSGADQARSRLVDAIRVAQAALVQGERAIVNEVLMSMEEVSVREAEWTASEIPGMEPVVLHAVKSAVATAGLGRDVVVKSLGAGDAVGMFFDRRNVAESTLLQVLGTANIQARVVHAGSLGTRVECYL